MSGGKGGRPSKTDLEERKRRKKKWLLEEERRRQMESRIKQGLVKVTSWEDGVVQHLRGEASDPDALVTAPPNSPAMQFLFDKIKGVSTEQFDRVWRQGMIDLLASDLPLDEDKRARGHIAAELWKLTYPHEAKRNAMRAKVEVIKWCLADAEHRGETPSDAREQVAADYGFPSGEALRKFLQKNQHLLDKP
jgi:hypothetical protein